MNTLTYLTLFAISFGAATIIPLPMQSEAAITALFLMKKYAPLALVAWASVGNTLGSVVNWAIGCEAVKMKKFPLKPELMERAKGWYARYGRWSLLLSWVPFMGDPITLAAGAMRERLSVFIPIIAVAKTARYAALMMLLT